MIEAVIYGDTPRANIEKILKAPPLIKLNISKKKEYIWKYQIFQT